MTQNRLYRVLSLGILLLTQQSMAAPNYQLAGNDLSTGQALQSGSIFSGLVNPASLSANQDLKPDYIAFAPSVGFAIEYGNVDEIFDSIDELAIKLGGSDKDGSGGDGSEGSGGGSGEGSLAVFVKQILSENVDFKQIAQDNPGLEQAIIDIGTEVAVAGTLLAIMADEIYAKADAQLDIPIIIGTDIAGGNWALAINSSMTSKVFGIADIPKFDKEFAKQQIRNYLNADAADKPETIDLSAGFLLKVDPTTGAVSGQFENESVLLTKVAQVDEFALNYGRQMLKLGSGKLHLGTKLKFLRVGVSQVGFRLGDVTDSEKIFDDLRNAEFEYDNQMAIDVGAVWQDSTYNLGLTIVNATQPEFTFSEIEVDGYKEGSILTELKKHDAYIMEPQAKLSAGVFTQNKQWSLSLGLDTNGVKDIMRDASQWASIAGVYTSDTWSLPSARLGYRKNMVGTELSYLSAGLTLFDFLNVDVASSLETVEVNGATLPRSFAVNLGIAQNF